MLCVKPVFKYILIFGFLQSKTLANVKAKF